VIVGKRFSMHAQWATMLSLCVVATGCGVHYEEHKITEVHANAGGILSQSSMTVTLPEGAVLTASVEPYDSDDDVMEDAEITTDEPAIMEVIRVSGDSDVTFAFVGRRAGETTVRYYAEGEEVRSERATVTAR
jgi:hypothetical protein